MGKYKFGLASVEMGDIESDGGMGQTLIALGDTIADSMTLTSDEDQTTDINIEESDTPIKTIVSQRGAMKLAWSHANLSPQRLAIFFGGTVTGDGSATPYVWSAPDIIPDLEQSIKVTDKNSPATTFSIARAQVTPKFNLNFNKSGVGQIDLVATILQPEKSGEKRLVVTELLP